MSIVTDIYYMNLKTAKKALKSLMNNWLIIFTGLIYSTILFVGTIVSPLFWILSRMFLLILSSAMVSNYLYLLEQIIEKDRFSLQDFKDGFLIYLRKVWSVYFIGFVVLLGLDIFLRPMIVGLVGPFVYQFGLIFLMVFLMNALPETIYQKSYNGWESIKYSVEFIKEHWIEWYLPNLLLVGIFTLITGSALINVFNNITSLGTITQGPFGILLYILGQLWFSYGMIYRGLLFKLLNTSSRRKRLFMRNM
jgi:hypothetical protein